MKKKLDSTDISILNLLKENAYITNKQIAERISLTTSPVFKRIKSLRESGIIIRYTVELDEQQINPHMVAFTMVKLNEHSFDCMQVFRHNIKKLSEVTHLYQVTGGLDFMLRVQVSDMAEYDKFLNMKLGRIPEVNHMTTLTVLKEEKLT